MHPFGQYPSCFHWIEVPGDYAWASPRKFKHNGERARIVSPTMLLHDSDVFARIDVREKVSPAICFGNGFFTEREGLVFPVAECLHTPHLCCGVCVDFHPIEVHRLPTMPRRLGHLECHLRMQALALGGFLGGFLWRILPWRILPLGACHPLPWRILHWRLPLLHTVPLGNASIFSLVGLRILLSTPVTPDKGNIGQHSY